MNMLMRASCLELPPLMDRLIRSENNSKPPKKYMRDIKLKSIVDAAIIPMISMLSTMNLHHTPAFLFNLFISGSETSESVSSIWRSLAGIALFKRSNFVFAMSFAPPISISSKTNGFGGGCHLTEVLFFLFNFL